MKTANERLVEVRIALGFQKKAEFAERVGIERSTYDKMEKGPHKPSADNLEKIAAKFSEVNLNWLLLGQGPMLFLEGSAPTTQLPPPVPSEAKPTLPGGGEGMKIVRPTYEELAAENIYLHKTIEELRADKGHLWQQNAQLIEMGKADASADAATPTLDFFGYSSQPHRQVAGLVRYDAQPSACVHYDLATGRRVVELQAAA